MDRDGVDIAAFYRPSSTGHAVPRTERPEAGAFARRARVAGLRRGRVVAEWLVLVLVAFQYAGPYLLDFDARQLQQSGEHAEAATQLILAEVSLKRYGEIPRWNPFMLTGFPLAGDLVGHFWSPLATLPVLLWDGVTGMKVSAFLLFVLAGGGQWALAHAFGVRGVFRWWAALIFMLSGGLALLWRLGWYALLLGAAWFPWCCAALWWAVRARGRTPLVLAAVCLALLLHANTVYYQVYTAGAAAVLVSAVFIQTPSPERANRLRRTVLIAVLAGALAAVTLAPLLDGLRFTRREAAPDLRQEGSQPIPYALVGFVVAQPEWFRSDILGQKGGWSWFYIGFLPVAGLTAVALAMRRRRRRRLIVTLIALTLFLLAWNANRHTPFALLYEAFPWLYQFRFPGRLLIIAASPLIVLAAAGIQEGYRISRRAALRAMGQRAVRDLSDRPLPAIGHRLVLAAFAVGLVWSARDAFSVNRAFAFHRDPIPPASFEVLGWLRAYDGDLYYTNVGGGSIDLKWTPAAYLLEMPLINFIYNRYVAQHNPNEIRDNPDLPFIARPRYQISSVDQPAPPDAELVRDFQGLRVWRLRNALPFAFAVDTAQLGAGRQLVPADVAPLRARFDGPNRVVVTGGGTVGEQLVVLVSDYPGWRLYVDGRRVPVTPVNGFLGGRVAGPAATYTFAFEPATFYAGAAVNAIALALAGGILVVDALGGLTRTVRRLSGTADRAGARTTA
jgi:hypothetical protein